LINCRVYAAIVAVALVLPARGPLVGAAVAKIGVTQAAGQSSAAQQAPGTHTVTNPAPAGSAMHSITVQFDYDFTKTPVCAAKVTPACVKTFDVYDISGEKPYLLFSIPAPANAQGLMKGITATSPRMLFAIGKHRIGVSAQMANGEKSPPRDCKIVIEIKPESPPSPSSPPASH
jgi:hypothetical protein